jgi:uncharacterized protein (DUF2236 family)
MGRWGPDSASWHVMRERAVVIGGVRALLLQTAHPEIAAAGQRTGKYIDDPWGRLENTLRLTFQMVFGDDAEILGAASVVNDTHRAVGRRLGYEEPPLNAARQDLMLWVYGTLVTSLLLFESRIIGSLDRAGRQRFHEEFAASNQLLGLKRSSVPDTIEELDAFMDQVTASGVLTRTDTSNTLGEFINTATGGFAHPVSAIGKYLAFHTLPVQVRAIYDVGHTKRDDILTRSLFRTVKVGHRLSPRTLRWTPMANAAYRRLDGHDVALADIPVLPVRRLRGRRCDTGISE